MLLKLYCLGAALALMPLLVQLQGVYHRRFFPNITEYITDTTFPVNLTAETTSDMVLMKCPFRKYKHINATDSFIETDEIEQSKIEDLIFQSRAFIWIPLMRKLSNKIQQNCGKVRSKSFNNSDIEKDWIFNVIWNKNSQEETTVFPANMNSLLPEYHQTCSYNIDEIIIVTKDKKDNIPMRVDPHKIMEPYTKQMFYYFLKPNDNDMDSIKKPCVIMKGFKGCPIINLPGYSETSITSEAIKKISIEDLKGQEKNIDVNLLIDGKKDFYRDEEISLSRMRYTKSGFKVIENSIKSITSSFVINGFDLVKLVYNCWNGGGNQNVSKTYYFGPTLINLMQDKTEDISANDTSIRVKCDTSYLNVGYLKGVKYNGIHAGVEDLDSTDTLRGKFSKGENSISFVESDNGTTIITCIYKTLDGSITTNTKFINKDTIAFNEKNLEEQRQQHLLNISSQQNETNRLKIAEIEKNYEKRIDKIKKQSQETNKSLFKKFSDKVGERNAYILVAGFILLILIILAVLIVILYKKWLNPFIIMLKQKRKYPNVYVFWKNLTSQPFDSYCQAIKEKKYLSNKVLNQIVVKKMEGGEEVDVGVSHLFDKTLVKCYRRFPRKIKAHYIYTDIEKRKYILSDGLTKDTQSTFWQMIYEEDIGTIVAIVYDKKTLDVDEDSDEVYWKWKTNKRVFGNVVVTRMDDIKVNTLFVTGHKLLLEKEGGETRNLEIYHVSNWKENDIPQSDLQFVNMYQEIIKDSQKKNILIHSPEGTGARVYMFTYFACIYDALKSENETDCPLKIIKTMREQRYGGNIVPYEFAYVIKALVTVLFNNKVLMDFSSRRADFYSSYDAYFYDYLRRQAKMDEDLKKFLDFVNIVDEGKIYEYKSVFDTLGRLDSDLLPEYCKRFLTAVKNHKEGKDKKRFRYSDIPCIDASGVTINGKSEAESDSFIHANKFEYKTVTDTRKLILCQAPTEETKDDMLDMILRYKIGVVVILVKPEEATDNQNKWLPYYPTQHYELDTPNFTLTRISMNKLDENFIAESKHQLRCKKTQKGTSFYILHYQGWSDKSIPSDHKSVYELYKKIISLRNDDCVAIHCSAGIGKTGTLALIMYLIDTINYFPTFDPIARLKCLREHRYLAVQKHNQFVFALLVVFEHYKKEIDEMDEGAYGRFLGIAENLFNKERTRQDRQKK